MVAEDLEDADRVMRLAFGTHLDLLEPLDFLGDADFVRSRFRANPDAAFAAEADGQLIGTVFVANWGSVGFLGPLTITPQWWDRGVAQLLLEPVMQRFADWGTRHAGLYTFASSSKHHSLYQKFGFWPRSLRPVMSRKVQPQAVDDVQAFSTLDVSPRGAALQACAELTGMIYEGLDVGQEIRAVQKQRLGDTLIISDAEGVAGFAVCHCGPGSEAGSGRCYIKFAAVRSGVQAEARLGMLLRACDDFAADNRASRLVAGVSAGRSRAYREMLALGFRADQVGVSMHNPDAVGYDTENVFILDDWR